MASHGLTQVDLKERWGDFLDRGWVRRAMLWEGQDAGERDFALQIEGARRGPPLGRITSAPSPALDWGLLELGASLSNYAQATLGLGGRAACCVADSDAILTPYLRSAGIEVWEGSQAAGAAAALRRHGPLIIAQSSGVLNQRNGKVWANSILALGTEAILADAPQTQSFDPIIRALGSSYSCSTWLVSPASVGDPTTTPRSIMMAVMTTNDPPGGRCEPQGTDPQSSPPRAGKRPESGWKLSTDNIPSGCWCAGVSSRKTSPPGDRSRKPCPWAGTSVTPPRAGACWCSIATRRFHNPTRGPATAATRAPSCSKTAPGREVRRSGA